MTEEKSGSAQAIITATIVPTPATSKRNHCCRQRQTARVATEVKKAWRRCRQRETGRAIRVLPNGFFIPRAVVAAGQTQRDNLALIIRHYARDFSPRKLEEPAADATG